MNNYLEELEFGDCFIYNGNTYILTTDSKKNLDVLCIDLNGGSSRWLSPETLVNKIAIFYTDSESNIISIKETKKNVDY